MPEFGLNDWEQGLVVGASTLAAIPGGITIGPLSDFVGRKKVQFLFPWELSNLGTALTFFIYGLFALIGLILVSWLLPETKGKSLEQIEREFTAAK